MKSSSCKKKMFQEAKKIAAEKEKKEKAKAAEKKKADAEALKVKEAEAAQKAKEQSSARAARGMSTFRSGIFSPLSCSFPGSISRRTFSSTFSKGRPSWRPRSAPGIRARSFISGSRPWVWRPHTT